MGYHVTIVRALPITREEVIGIARELGEWNYDPEQDALVSLHDSPEAAALWFSDGEIWTKNPNVPKVPESISF